MSLIAKPKSADEYVKLVEQAVTELNELRASLEYDMEEEGARYAFVEPLEQEVRRLRASMADGSYQFENKDLPFMVIVNRFRSRIPFSDLLALINRTHREGLDIE